MSLAEILVMISLSGFHVGITLLALYRARTSLLVARREARADRRTLVRLASLRLVAATVILAGGLLAVCTPLLLVAIWGTTFLPISERGMAVLLVGAWFVWIPATILLDNLALRWWKQRTS